MTGEDFNLLAALSAIRRPNAISRQALDGA